MKRSAIIRMVSVLSLVISNIVGAEENITDKWQVSVGIGSASASGTLNHANAIVDDSDTSYEVTVGYSFNEDLTFTAGYVDLGEASTTFDIETPLTDLENQVTSVLGDVPVLADGVVLGLTYHFYDQGNWSLGLTGGVFFWESQVSAAGDGVVVSRAKRGSDITYGVAGAYNISSSFSTFLSFKRYALAPNDVDEVSIGISYRF